MLKQENGFFDCDEIDAEFLTKATSWLQTYDEVKADIQKIAQMLEGKVMFVTHCNVIGENGTKIPEREELIEWVEKAGAELGLTVFNPTKLIDRYCQAFAMARQGADSSHYSLEFESILADEFYDKYISQLPHPA